MAPTGKKRPGKPKAAPKKKTVPDGGDVAGFPAALAKLLRSKKIPVPKGLLEAPPEAYVSQPASAVEQLEAWPATQLKQFAVKVATHVARQTERARTEWESSPLIAELRRRKLKEPPVPVRPKGASVPLTTPLEKWTDKKILKAAGDWSRLAQR